MDHSCYGGEGVPVVEKGKRQTGTQGSPHGEDEPPKQLAWKVRGTDFMSSCNHRGLKPGILKVSRLGSGKAQRTLGLFL